MKQDYIIKTYNKGKKSFYLNSLRDAFLTSVIIILFIDLMLILKEGISNYKFLLFSSLGGMASFVFIYCLFIPEKWDEVVKKYNKLEKK